MHIGLTGYMGSGKGEIAKILMKRGFKYISLSDVVREEAKKIKKESTRENLQRIGNNLRRKFGAGVLGKRVREIIEASKYKNWIIDGIRNPGEVEELQKLKEFHLIGLTAPAELILKRLLKRGRTKDEKSAKKIRQQLEREHGAGEELSGQHITKCLDLVDYLIINKETLRDLKRKLEHFFGLLRKTERPSFDEIFMEIAYAWAKRTTCLRRAVGAVIAKDKQQLTAGYNGAPRGLKHCAELGGCLRQKLGIKSGERHEICRGTHAEQNAITQAAKFGISIEGSTLYCNTLPCVICTKMIINAGIKKVVYDSDYDDDLSKQILGEQKVLELSRYEGKKFN